MSEAKITLHLTPGSVWEAQADKPAYLPEAFAADGFIHCTNGEELVIQVANRYYTSDPRPFCVLSIEVDRVSARVIYEDPDRVYPHIYGPLNTDAVVGVRSIERDAGGRFTSIETERASPSPRA